MVIRAFGIDQGIANCGYGIIDLHINEKGEIVKKVVIKSAVIRTSSKKPQNKRIEEIYNKLKEVILEFNPDCMSCERLFFTPPRNGARNMSASILNTNMITAIVYLLSSELDLDFKDFVPSQVKKAVTGNGRASKEEVKESILEILGLEKDAIKNEHRIDGLSIAYVVGKYFLEKNTEEENKDE